jgi:solute carrier family 35 (adenosine 3'-phospho 5'-phosphosulfate transporter), member B3
VQVFAGVAALVVFAVYITNVALYQVPYSLKIVVKSSRVLPVMAFSVLLQGVTYSLQQTAAALVLVSGVGLFLAADSVNLPQQPVAFMGIMFLVVSVMLDAAIANLEEKHFFRMSPASSRTEVIALLSAFAGLYSIIPLIFTGVCTHALL